MTTMMMLRIGGGMMRIAIEIIIPPMVKKMVVTENKKYCHYIS